MKVKIYARVSTDKQTHENQLHDVRRYCERRDWSEVMTEVVDTGSGGKTRRTGLDEFMAKVRKGKVDAIVVFKLDRLSRSLAHLAQLIAEFQTHGVALACTSQGPTRLIRTQPRSSSSTSSLPSLNLNARSSERG